MSVLIHQKRLRSMLRLWSWFQKLFPTYCFVLPHYQECRDNDRLPQCTPIKMLALIMMLFDKVAYMHSCCGSISVYLVISTFWKEAASWRRWKGTLFSYFYDKKILNICFVLHCLFFFCLIYRAFWGLRILSTCSADSTQRPQRFTLLSFYGTDLACCKSTATARTF